MRLHASSTYIKYFINHSAAGKEYWLHKNCTRNAYIWTVKVFSLFFLDLQSNEKQNENNTCSRLSIIILLCRPGLKVTPKEGLFNSLVLINFHQVQCISMFIFILISNLLLL